MNSTVLIYDGDCAFCTKSVQWGYQHLDFFPESVPYQEIKPSDFKLTQEQVTTKVWLHVDSTNLGGHRAVSWLLRSQPRFYWKILGWLLIFPLFSPIAALGYSLVARYRHKLPGATNACRMDSKGSRD